MNLKFRMLCSDIDGTLLDKNRSLSAATKNALAHIWHQYGVPTVLVSSRMPSAMQHLLDEVPLPMPLIAYNGALVLSAAQQVLHSVFTPARTAMHIAALAEVEQLHIGLYRFDEWVTPQEDYWALREINNTKVRPQYAPMMPALEAWQADGVHKVMLMGDADRLSRCQALLQQHFANELHLYRSKDTYLEINAKQVSKASAIALVQTLWNIPTEAIIAFGDNWNDTEMLAYVGHGCAMQNAPDGVKAFADEIAPHHHEDGVAQVIHRYFNIAAH
jgi:Cof subfamily protein (haloacid dehalogenase superfamily)